MEQRSANSVDLVDESPHAIGEDPRTLRQILLPGINLGLWQRPAEVSIAEELLQLKISDLPDMRCSTRLGSFDDDVCALLEQRKLDSTAFINWRRDLHYLADCYFSVCGGRDVTMRLVTTNEDGCRRFHADRTNLRLLCTYRGPGTEWLPDEQVDRLALEKGAPNDSIVRHGSPSELAPFWAGIMKGEGYPGNKGRGLVHRSPAIGGSGQTRVLFCLDC